MSPVAVDRADALARFSEGWCPICGTRFREYEGFTEMHCERGVRRSIVRADIDRMWPEQVVS